MWTGVYLSGRVKKKILMYCGLQYEGLLRAHVMLLSYYIGIHGYFMSINVTFAVTARTRKVSRRPCICPTTGNILILYKPLSESIQYNI